MNSRRADKTAIITRGAHGLGQATAALELARAFL